MSASPEQIAALWATFPAIIGGVIGALAGGLPAWFIAKRQSDEALKRERDKQYAHERTLSFKVHVKLTTIGNNVIHDWLHIRKQMKVLEEPTTAHMDPWQALQPIIGRTRDDNMQFDAEELAIFMAAGHHDFVSDLILLAQRSSVANSVMQDYNLKREELKAISPLPEEYEGSLGKSSISVAELLKLMPYIVPLNSLATQMSEAAEANLRLSQKIASAIGPIVKDYFKDPKAGGMSFPTDEELQQMLTEPAASPA